ncbi:single-stranded DNA-binding protein [Micromonospora sp. NPDC000316]|uniref:single-stranded DNA-binding protein n=1 Tax=Micromonospora sp. NPDC000316 TaxID=3364216 RepID=UPI0036B9CE0A
MSKEIAMANDTTVTVVGNLTADPELRFTPAGVALVKFTVASTPRVFDRSSGEYRDGDPLFLTCTAWRDLAEHIAESLAKGTRVVVAGRLRLSRWENEEGEKRSAYGLDVDEVGPSLRFATASVKKMARSRTGDGFTPETPADDPWSTAAPASAA